MVGGKLGKKDDDGLKFVEVEWDKDSAIGTMEAYQAMVSSLPSKDLQKKVRTLALALTQVSE